MDIDELLKQIQKETTNSRLKIEQCNVNAKRGLKAYLDDLLRKQADIEKDLEAHILKVVEENPPRRTKYQEFRNEKIAAFNRIKSDTENDMHQIKIKIEQQTESLKKTIENVIEKMNVLAKDVQNMHANFKTVFENEPIIMDIKCTQLFTETARSFFSLRDELLKCLKLGLEAFQQINKEMYVTVIRRGERNKRRYNTLMKKFQVKFENIKYKIQQ